MSLHFIGITLEMIGSILIAYTAVRVNYRFRKEHKIDEKVFLAMEYEQYVGMFGIVLLILGFVFQVPGEL